MPIYGFHCSECGAVTDKIMKSEERPEEVPCEECPKGTATYQMGKPGYFRVKYDQHGRIGYRYDMGGGKTLHRSATKERYEQNLGNKSAKDLKAMGDDKNRSVYTKDYDRHVRAQEKKVAEQRKKLLKEIK